MPESFQANSMPSCIASSLVARCAALPSCVPSATASARSGSGIRSRSCGRARRRERIAGAHAAGCAQAASSLHMAFSPTTSTWSISQRSSTRSSPSISAAWWARSRPHPTPMSMSARGRRRHARLCDRDAGRADQAAADGLITSLMPAKAESGHPALGSGSPLFSGRAVYAGT